MREQILPRLLRKPKDKAKVEAAVGLATRWILAVLRNRTFFSLAEARVAVRELLDKFDAKKSRLRTYLRLCVDSFVMNEDKEIKAKPGDIVEIHIPNPALARRVSDLDVTVTGGSKLAGAVEAERTEGGRTVAGGSYISIVTSVEKTPVSR